MTMMDVLIEDGWITCPNCNGQDIITYTEPTQTKDVIACVDCEYKDTIHHRRKYDV